MTRHFLKTTLALCGALTLLCSLTFCSGPPTQTGPVDPAKYGLSELCPGTEGCMNPKGDLYAGASAVVISPKNYEVARFAYMGEEGYCPTPTPKSPFGLWRCGGLVERAIYGRKDCGTDGLCVFDKFKTRVACDANKMCPNGLRCEEKDNFCYLEYSKPDEDGSEKDGLQDWFLDCGRDNVCPCVDTAGQPSYYSADKKTCLKGHTKNPDYKGPDADGTEGNNKFEGVWMAGFDGNHPMQGHHDDIWARTLVLRTGDTAVAIVSLDLVGYFNNKVQEVRKRVKELLPNKEIDHILISSTHVHEGPDVIGQWGQHQAGVPTKTGANPEYAKALIEKISQSIVDAYKNLKKAELKIARIDTGREGFLRDSRDPKIFHDEMNVILLTDIDSKKNICTLVNWGNHPEVLSDSNNYLTSDYSHYLREALEKGLKKGPNNPEYAPLGGVALYLQGAVGGLMTPLRVDVKDLNGTVQNKSNWDKSKALGENLAVKAFEALKTAETIKDATLSFWAKRMIVPMENKVFQAAFNIDIFDRVPTGYNPDQPITADNVPKIDTEISVIRLGEISFFSAPGELDPEILVGGYDGSRSLGIEMIDPKNPNPPDLKKAPKGPYLKERIPGKYKLFVGLGNDFLGYILPSWNYQLDEKNAYYDQAKGNHYEETNGIGPQMGPTLLKTYDELIPFLQTPGPPPAK